MPSHASNARTSIQSLKRGFLSTHTSPQRMNLIHPQHLTNYRRPEIVFPPHRWKFFTDQYLFCCLAASNSHFRILRLINFFLSCNVRSSTRLFFLNSIGGLPVVPTRGLHWLHVLLTHHKSQRVAKMKLRSMLLPRLRGHTAHLPAFDLAKGSRGCRLMNFLACTTVWERQGSELSNSFSTKQPK